MLLYGIDHPRFLSENALQDRIEAVNLQRCVKISKAEAHRAAFLRSAESLVGKCRAMETCARADSFIVELLGDLLCSAIRYRKGEH